MVPRSVSNGTPQRGSASEVVGENIRVHYENKTAVEVDRIVLPAGRTYALLGASGAGKSTLLRVLGLLEEPASGSVLYDGQPVARNDLAARRRIAAVFQKPYMLRGTVGYNTGYGLKLRGVGRAERKHRVAEALATVGLAGWEDRAALTLSGGEAQRIALARALVLRPNLLLLDEPLSYMDPILKRGLTREFAEILASEQVTALYVTHDQDEAAVVADLIGIMRDGRIVTEGDPRIVLAIPADPWVASFLGTEMPLRGTVVAESNGVVTVKCAGGELLAVSQEAVGTQVVAGVRPEDVLVFGPGLEMPRTAARNQLAAEVVEVIHAGVNSKVVVDVGGCRLAATLTQSSIESLHLESGAAVTVLFEASAVRAVGTS